MSFQLFRKAIYCKDMNDEVILVLAAYWNLALITSAPQNYTYSVTAADRQGVCGAYLSSGGCPGTLVDIYGVASLLIGCFVFLQSDNLIL